jgi:hypothetical protein
VSSLWEQRAARNEALFREVNENVARLEDLHDTTGIEPRFVCECADPDCVERITLSRDTYRHVREDPRHFVLRPGHEDPQLERVVERHSDYLIVEKFGEAGQIAEKTQG